MALHGFAEGYRLVAEKVIIALVNIIALCIYGRELAEKILSYLS
jgi:hypothetical protein